MSYSDGLELSAIPGRDVYTVTRLNNEVRDLLESSFPPLWVEGEISNLACPRSGHLYFSLKDQNAQVRCAMFRTYNRHLDFAPENGGHVLVRARVGLYAQRGDFQLVIEYMEEAGAGALRRAFEALKQRLAAEGLFDLARKKSLPAVPHRIGIITSPTGAAIRDVLSVLKRRFPAVPVLIYPVPVQGAGAAEAIADALALANQRDECDVLILTRGGGSLEDLWAFNEEQVARAIRAGDIPVVTGIGHEIDFTIADFAADQRAPTPSAAAELVTPDRGEWRQRMERLRARLTARMQYGLQERRNRLSWLLKRLQYPRRRWLDLVQRADGLGLRLMRTASRITQSREARLKELTARLNRHEPSVRLRAYASQARQLAHRARHAGLLQLKVQRARLQELERALETVSPLRTLDRGYAIVTRYPGGEVLRSAETVGAGDRVAARLARGTLQCTVDKAEET